MRRLHSRVRVCRPAGKNGLLRGRSLAGVVLLLLMVLTFAGTSMAQFSGPAVDLNTNVNRPLVPTTDPAILFPVSREIQLGQGDLLAVHLFGSSTTTRSFAWHSMAPSSCR